MTYAPAPAMNLKSSVMLLALAAVWGGSFFFAEIVLREVPPLTITLHRVFWAVPILGLIVRLKGIIVPRSAHIWGAYLVMGALLIPPFAITLGTLFLGERIGADAFIGFVIIALGFAVTDGRLFSIFFKRPAVKAAPDGGGMGN